jgi:hypothetical protein
MSSTHQSGERAASAVSETQAAWRAVELASDARGAGLARDADLKAAAQESVCRVSPPASWRGWMHPAGARPNARHVSPLIDDITAKNS